MVMNRSRADRALGRRKACDFCCQKKIRCDARRPKCSGCSLHDVACAWTPGIQVKKRTVKTRALEDSCSSRFESLERRVEAVETQLSHDHSRGCLEAGFRNPSTSNAAPSPASWVDTPSRHITNMPRQIDSVSRQQDEFPLPPRLEVFSLATDYFKHLNQAIPLFQHDQFFKIIEAWYQDPPVRDAPSWAVINVVMALSLRHMPLERAPESNYLASACISHAQSVMESLIYRDQDLKGLQVLLSLCIFFFGSSYPQPAFIFIATAVKLVHRMKLHTKAKDNEFNGEIVSQRKCLFWITYIIDREMSAHSFEPYLLHDDDIDVEVYGLSQEDDAAGNLTVREDGSSISLFGLRIQLARIQGKIYDLIHSVRAQKISINQKNAATERLHQILKEWYTLIPEPFSLSTAPLDESAHWLRNLLHIEYYQCLFMAHRIHALNYEWINKLKAFGDGLLLESDGMSQAQSEGPLLPPNWPILVEASRECLAMYNLTAQSNSTPAVSSTCTLHAAVTVLLANTLTVSEHDLHDHLDADIKTIQASLSEIERRLQDREIPVLRMALNMSYDLSTRATAALARFYESSSIEAFWDVGVALN